MIRVRFTRDSVCMADDCHAPHEHLVTVVEGSLLDVLSEVLARAPLARISGGRATWGLIGPSRILGVVAEQWAKPKLIWGVGVQDLRSEGSEIGHLHASYFAQQDPDVIFETLRKVQFPNA